MELDMATIRKRSNGSYEIKVSCGYGVDGKQRVQYKTWNRKTQDEMLCVFCAVRNGRKNVPSRFL